MRFLVLLRPLPESSAVKSPCICSAGTREYILYVFCSPSRVAVTSPAPPSPTVVSLTRSPARSCSFTRRSFVPVRLLSLCHVRNAVGCAHSQQRQRRSAACVSVRVCSERLLSLSERVICIAGFAHRKTWLELSLGERAATRIVLK